MKEGSYEDEKKSFFSHVGKGDKWIIHSCFSHHMIGDKSKFESMEQYRGSSAKFNNDALCLVKGK